MSIAQPWHLGVVFLYFIKGSPYLLVGLGPGRMDIATRHRLFSQLISSFNVIIVENKNKNTTQQQRQTLLAATKLNFPDFEFSGRYGHYELIELRWDFGRVIRVWGTTFSGTL
jgi:hypothetical protein